MLRCVVVLICLGIAAPARLPAQTPHEPELGAPGDARAEWSDGRSAYARLRSGLLRLTPCEAGVTRVSFVGPDAAPPRDSDVAADADCHGAPFVVVGDAKSLAIETSLLRIAVDRYSGAVSFLDKQRRLLLSEQSWPRPRSLAAARPGAATPREASVWFALAPDEKLYGFGQHQNGLLDQRGLEFELTQDNTNISIPFFLSTKGYGVLWSNASATRANSRFLPTLSLRSSSAEAVDYYFLYGPQFDSVIAACRRLTGAAPLFPRWAFGYWQSRLAYSSQRQLLETSERFRRLALPLDALVVDMGWETKLGSRKFNANFAAPREMLAQLRARRQHLMLSLWPLFEPGSENFDFMLERGLFVAPPAAAAPAYLPGSRLYDAFNPEARAAYWRQARPLRELGVEAFWLDSTEPLDMFGEAHGTLLEGAQTAAGDGARVANLYPLMAARAVYEGQRADSSERVFTLTRSAFIGQQRYAAAVWSGDVATNFDALRRQIAAGLNYSMSGLPWWTSDIGGFVGGDARDADYRELYARWFEFGAFSPIMRAHGARSPQDNEPWSYGEKILATLALYDRLRNRLSPYAYATAARVTHEGYTPMRALAFDFREDARALTIADEFMYGPSLLAAPVVEAGARMREVYLPAGAEWFDFWSGERWRGGQRVRRAAPLDVLPLYVRAGSILPLAAEALSIEEQRGLPVELRVYPGADADFVLYDDDGESYAYERGERTLIRMHWSEAQGVLRIAAREGSYAGMPRRRRFMLVLVARGRGVGAAATPGAREIVYDGAPLDVSMR